jgi:hypothetical protein
MRPFTILPRCLSARSHRESADHVTAFHNRKDTPSARVYVVARRSDPHSCVQDTGTTELRRVTAFAWTALLIEHTASHPPPAAHCAFSCFTSDQRHCVPRIAPAAASARLWFLDAFDFWTRRSRRGRSLINIRGQITSAPGKLSPKMLRVERRSTQMIVVPISSSHYTVKTTITAHTPSPWQTTSTFLDNVSRLPKNP